MIEARHTDQTAVEHIGDSDSRTGATSEGLVGVGLGSVAISSRAPAGPLGTDELIRLTKILGENVSSVLF